MPCFLFARKATKEQMKFAEEVWEMEEVEDVIEGDSDDDDDDTDDIYDEEEDEDEAEVFLFFFFSFFCGNLVPDTLKNKGKGK